MAAEDRSPDRRHEGARVPWRLVGLVAVGYAAGSLIAFLLFEASTAGAVLFPPAGVTLAALVLTPRRQWPWVLATAVVTELVVDVSQGQSLSVVWGFALANTLEPLVSAALLRRFVGRVDLSRRRDLAAFVGLAVVAGPFVGGIVGATTIALGFGSSWLTALPQWWAGDALGALTVGGTILAWHGARRAGGSTSLGAVLLVMLATAAVTVVAFWPMSVPVAYLPMPLLFWLAFRYGVVLVAAAGLAMTLTANVLTAAGHGPWAALADTPRAEVATLQLFLAVAILAAWLLAVEIKERERAARLYEQEHEAAHQLQRALLPEVPARLEGAEIAVAYRPADAEHDVGGDWYDVFSLADGRLAFVVGDIVGHDLDAAAAMGRLHAALRAIAAGPHRGAGQVLEALDRASARIHGPPGSTVGYAEYDARDGTLRYACAGHPPPLLAQGGEACFLEGGRSPLLGLADVERGEDIVTVPAGAMLLWYSDGLVERRGADLDEGLQRLADVAAGLDATAGTQQWCDTIMAEMVGDLRIEDDVALVCLRLQRRAPAPGVDGVRLSENGSAVPTADDGDPLSVRDESTREATVPVRRIRMRRRGRR